MLIDGHQQTINELKIQKQSLERTLREVTEHGEKAFHEAVAAQDMLKVEKALAEGRLSRLEGNGIVRTLRRLGVLGD